MDNINIGLRPLLESPYFHYATWDIEASDWWTLQVIGLWDGERYYHFQTIEAFLDFALQRKYRDWRFFAHFGGRYDTNFIFDVVRDRSDIHVSFYCAGAMVLGMTLERGDQRIKLCDSYRLLPASLRDLGKAFQVEHPKTEYDFEAMAYSKELLEYNEQDCRCLYEVLEQFFEQTGVRSETFATQSLRVFRKNYQKEVLWQPHEHVSRFVRRSYVGGRTEIFKRGAPDLNVYDVNSMYPFVMIQSLPVRYIAESRTLRENWYGFVYAKVRIPEIYIPILPVRREKLYFPTGIIEGVWTVEELLHSQYSGVEILTIYQGYYFETTTVFEEYIRTLYEQKKKAAEPLRTIAKFLLNSFYGKFGQNPLKKMYVKDNRAPFGSFPILTPDGKETGFSYYERQSRAAYLLPHLSSAVTSKARLVLAARLNHNAYYCDTDSIFTNQTMVEGKGLGDWSHVGSGDARFYQPKLYYFAGTWKSKGLNKNEDIAQYIEGGINHVMRHRSIKEALRYGVPACASLTIEKRLHDGKPKRAWIGDDTRPWDIKELDSYDKRTS